MARCLKGDAAIEHLKVGGTLWSCGGVGTSYWFWSTRDQRPVERWVCDGREDQGRFVPSCERKVRTEPPKTISAEEARQVVAAGGAVARTFVAPESEWVEHTFRWYERIVDGDGEWVVRRAATEKAGVLTTEEKWALRRAEEGQELNKHEQCLLIKALRRLVGGEK